MNMMTPENLQDLKKDAETAENPALAKLMKAWESKNAKRAAKGTGLTLMAVSLAACGGSSGPSPTPPTPPTPTPTTKSLIQAIKADDLEFYEIVGTGEGTVTVKQSLTAEDVIAGAENAAEITLAQFNLPVFDSLKNYLDNLPAFNEIAGDVAYTVDPTAVYNAGVVNIATAQSAFNTVTTLIAGAENSDLPAGDVFVWTVKDTAAGLLAGVGANDPWVTGADSLRIDDGATLSVAQLKTLLDAGLDTGNSTFSVQDTAENLFRVDNPSVLRFPEALGDAEQITVTTALTADQAIALLQLSQDSGVAIDFGINQALTIGVDTITGSSNDDVFIGNLQPNQLGQLANTLNTGDNLDGGEGRDKLIAELTGQPTIGGGVTAVRPTLSNIEEVYLTSIENEVVFNANLSSGVEQWWNVGSDADLSIINIKQIVVNPIVTIGMDGTFGDSNDSDGGANFTVTFDANAQPAEATIGEERDEVNVFLNNVGKGERGGTLSIGSNEPLNLEPEKTGIEVFNVTVGGLSSWLKALETTGARLTEVNIAGTVATTGNTILQIDDAFMDLTTFDAEGFAGQLGRFVSDFPVPNATENPIKFVYSATPATGSTFAGTATILGGDGRNRLDVELEINAGVNLTLNGGALNDVLTVHSGFTGVGTNFTSIDMNLGGGSNTATLTNLSGTGPVTITGPDTPGAGDTITLTNVSTTSGTIGDVTLQAFGGNNIITYTNSSVGNDLTVNVGIGNDTVTITNVGVGTIPALGSLTGDLEITAAGGNNIISYANANISGGATITTQDGNDTITVANSEIGTAGVRPGTLDIDAGNGLNVVTLDTVTMLGSHINITTGEDNDNVTLTNVTSAGPVTINTGGSDEDGDPANPGGVYQGDIVTINWGIFQNPTPWNLVTINTGDGPSQVTLNGNANTAGTGGTVGLYDDLTIITGAGSDDVALRGISFSASSFLRIDVSGDDSDNTIEVRNTLFPVGGLATIIGGDGTDTYITNMDLGNGAPQNPTRFTDIDILEMVGNGDGTTQTVDMEQLNGVADDIDSIVQVVRVAAEQVSATQAFMINNLDPRNGQIVEITNKNLPGSLSNSLNSLIGDVTISTKIADDDNFRTVDVSLRAENGAGSVLTVGTLNINDDPSIGTGSIEVVRITSTGGGDRNVVQNLQVPDAEFIRLLGDTDLILHTVPSDIDGLFSSKNIVDIRANTDESLGGPLSGNLTLVLEASRLSTVEGRDQLQGGTGNNKLVLYGNMDVVTAAAAAIATDITNFETIQFGFRRTSDVSDERGLGTGDGGATGLTAAASGSFDAAGFDGLSYVIGWMNAGAPLTLSNLADGATVTIGDDSVDTNAANPSANSSFRGRDITIDGRGGPDSELNVNIISSARTQDFEDAGGLNPTDPLFNATTAQGLNFLQLTVGGANTVNLDIAGMDRDGGPDGDDRWIDLTVQNDVRELVITGGTATKFDGSMTINSDLYLQSALPATLDVINVSGYVNKVTANMLGEYTKAGTNDVDVIVGAGDIHFTMAELTFIPGGTTTITIASGQQFDVTIATVGSGNTSLRHNQEVKFELDVGGGTLSVTLNSGWVSNSNQVTEENLAAKIAAAINDGGSGTSFDDGTLEGTFFAEANGDKITFTYVPSNLIDLETADVGAGSVFEPGSAGRVHGVIVDADNPLETSDVTIEITLPGTVLSPDYNTIFRFTEADNDSVWTIENFIIAGFTEGANNNNFTRLDVRDLGISELTELKVEFDDVNDVAIITSDIVGDTSWRIELTGYGSGIDTPDILNADTFVGII